MIQYETYNISDIPYTTMPYIQHVSYIYPTKDSGPAYSILWSTGVTHFYPWNEYPYKPDLSEVRPWPRPPKIKKVTGFDGILFFSATPNMNTNSISLHNIKHYKPSKNIPEYHPGDNPVPRLEAIAEEIDYISQQRLLYI